MTIKPRAWVLTLSLSLSAAAQAAGPAAEFSALAVQRTQDGEARSAHMFVSAERVRMEFERGGQQYVEIVDSRAGRMYLIMPAQGTYRERKVPAEKLSGLMGASQVVDPCAMLPGTQCVQAGREQVFGRSATKWELVASHEDQEVRALMWMDEERQMPLRQLWPDGTVAELRPMGSELLHGRSTEKWELITTRVDGTAVRSVQWFDPELKIAVREELPGGFYRELRDIKLGPQKEDLFRVPAGYQHLPEPEHREGAGAMRQSMPYPQHQVIEAARKRKP